MLALALSALSGARGRHDAVRTNADPMTAFAPISEAIYWAVVLDEQLRAWNGYEVALSELPGRPLLSGLRYVRNLLTHQLPLTLTQRDGRSYPRVYPLVFREVVWLASSELPAPEKTHKHTAQQRQAYDDYLASRPVRHTLTDLSALFATLQAYPGSPMGSAT